MTKDEFACSVLQWTLAYEIISFGRLANTSYISSVWTQDATEKTKKEQWTIELDGKRVSGKSLLYAQLDDDDDDDDDPSDGIEYEKRFIYHVR